MGRPVIAGRRGRSLTNRQRLRIRATREKRREHPHPGLRTGEGDGVADGLGPEQVGLVISNHGPVLLVEDVEHRLHRCAQRQHLGHVVTGDRVRWQPGGEGTGVVVGVEERKSVLIRPNFLSVARPIAANIDQLLAVVAPRPSLDEMILDRYLAAAECMGIGSLVVLNKADLLSAPEFSDIRDRLSLYTRLDYDVIETSKTMPEGLDTLRDRLRNQVSILVGQSGVGKSSLVRALVPGRDIRVRELSQQTGFGTHTTSVTTLYGLPGGGRIIDSPGVRGFEPMLSPEEVDIGYSELTPLLGRCRFSDCSHTVEPDCNLRQAVSEGRVDGRRVRSYLNLRRQAIERGKPRNG